MAAETCYSTSSKIVIMILVMIMSSGSMYLVEVAAVGINVETLNQKEWCIAKPGTGDQELTDILQYVCSTMKINCDPINNPSGACFKPNSLYFHASFAMNRYFQSRGHDPVNCYFGGIGRITLRDPSYKACFYDQA